MKILDKTINLRHITQNTSTKKPEKLGLNWTNGIMNELVQAKSDLLMEKIIS